MRKIAALLLLFIIAICIGACSKPASSFVLEFIDVGQGDSTLVECDGHYMLIDGGNKSSGDKVYSVLEERGVQHLDILAVSHMHEDHIGGLAKALTYASAIDKTIANATDWNTDEFRNFKHQLEGINGSKISVPYVGEKYSLGSAEVEVVYASAEDNNDSLVLLVTYGDTKYLFTGDIEINAQTKIANQYKNDFDKPFKIDIMKMPHHGANASILFIRTFMPDYAVISAGKGNQYNHPYDCTLDRLADADSRVYRTDVDGDITVKSDGKEIIVETSR